MADSQRAPSAWVVRFGYLLPLGGSVLDLACGSGRHARWLLDRGHCVTAVDRDIGQVLDLRAHPRAELLEADLETEIWPLDGRSFDGVVVTNYLWRPRLEDVFGLVAPGGALLYETFAIGNERFGRPQNPDFLLRPSELIERIAGRLTLVAYEHGVVSEPRPAVLQRLAAVCAELGSLDGKGTTARALRDSP